MASTRAPRTSAPLVARRCRGRHIVCWLAAWSSLGACADISSPPDDAPLSTLSADERVALCDDVRDVVTAVDRPVECDEGAVRLDVPTNQACRDADLSMCPGTAGDVRACYEWAQSDRCSAVRQLSQICLPVRGCDSAIVPAARYAYAPECPKARAEALRDFDGVYELTSSVAYADDERGPLFGYSPTSFTAPFEFGFEPATDLAGDALPDDCEPPPPVVIDAGGRWVVLVTTEVEGTPLVVLRNCSDVADCQARARAIRDAGDNASLIRGDDEYRAFYACESTEPGVPLGVLDALANDGARSCRTLERPTARIWRPDRELLVDVGGRSPTSEEESKGCGYVVVPSARERGPCIGRQQFGARFVAALEP